MAGNTKVLSRHTQKWHRNGLNIKKKCHKKLQLLLTVILKRPVLTNAVTEVNQAEELDAASFVRSGEDILP